MRHACMGMEPRFVCVCGFCVWFWVRACVCVSCVLWRAVSVCERTCHACPRRAGELWSVRVGVCCGGSAAAERVHGGGGGLGSRPQTHSSEVRETKETG
jgi:hypothetical protein